MRPTISRMAIGHLVVLVVLINQILEGISEVATKFVEMRGRPARILGMYRLILATVVLLPLTLIMQRKMNPRPRLTWKIVFFGFVGSFCGNFNLYVKNSASTMTESTLMYMSPIFGYLLAIVFRYERPVTIRSRDGILKIIGTLIAFGGSMILTFAKGPEISIWPKSFRISHDDYVPTWEERLHPKHSFGDSPVASFFLAFANSVLSALSTVIEAEILEKYLTSTGSCALVTTMGAIQSTLINVCMDKRISTAFLEFIVIITVPYTAMVGTVVVLLLEAWCIERKGPFFVASSKPIVLIVIGALSPLLDEHIYVGSVVGAVIVIVGVSMVLWAKRKDTGGLEWNVPQAEVELLSFVDQIYGL